MSSEGSSEEHIEHYQRERYFNRKLFRSGNKSERTFSCRVAFVFEGCWGVEIFQYIWTSLLSSKVYPFMDPARDDDETGQT